MIDDHMAIWELFPTRVEEIRTLRIDDTTRECMTAEALNEALLALLEKTVFGLQEMAAGDMRESGGRALEMLERFERAGHAIPEIRKMFP